MKTKKSFLNAIVTGAFWTWPLLSAWGARRDMRTVLKEKFPQSSVSPTTMIGRISSEACPHLSGRKTRPVLVRTGQLNSFVPRIATKATMIAAIFLSGCFATSAKYNATQGQPVLQGTRDSAAVHIYRTSIRSSFMPIEAFLDGKLVGVTKGGTYCSVYAEPGDHLLRTVMGGNKAELPLTLQAGSSYYVEQGFTAIGFIKLKEVSAQEGAANLRNLKQLQMKSP